MRLRRKIVRGAVQVVPLGDLHELAEQTCLPPGPVVQVCVHAWAQGAVFVNRLQPVPLMQKRFTCCAWSPCAPAHVYIWGGVGNMLPKTEPSWFGKVTSSPEAPMTDMLAAAETSSIDTCLPSRFAIDRRQAVTRSWQPASQAPLSQPVPSPSAPLNVYIVPYWSAFTRFVPV